MQANIHGDSILKGKPLQLIESHRGATALRPMSDRVEWQGLTEQGYAFVPGDEFALGTRQAANLVILADEWNRLEPDNYLRNQASFRERRYGRYAYHPSRGELLLLSHKPYFQSAKTNKYAGGVERVVGPVTPSFNDNPLLADLILYDFACFPSPEAWDEDWWLIACHMFRIIGRSDELGEPTPEGVHRDDIDFGAMHLMQRSNATGGFSRIHDPDHSICAELCLQRPMDTPFWADQDVLHSVTPIAPMNAERPALRDILILGFTHMPDLMDKEAIAS